MRLLIDFRRGPATPEAPPELLVALQAAHERDHALVHRINELDHALAQQNELARTKQIELEHAREDGQLWGLVVAWFVDVHGADRELEIPSDEVNRYQGTTMLDAANVNGTLTIKLRDRPEPSEEGRRG